MENCYLFWNLLSKHSGFSNKGMLKYLYASFLHSRQSLSEHLREGPSTPHLRSCLHPLRNFNSIAWRWELFGISFLRHTKSAKQSLLHLAPQPRRNPSSELQESSRTERRQNSNTYKARRQLDGSSCRSRRRDPGNFPGNGCIEWSTSRRGAARRGRCGVQGHAL